jgi:hypothetical protein
MSLKNAIVASIVWFVLITVFSGVSIWYIISNPVAGATAEQRSAMLGSGVGTVAVIGFAAIWLPFAFKLGQERRKAAALAARTRKGSSTIPK